MKKGTLFGILFITVACLSVVLDYNSKWNTPEVKGETTMQIASGTTYYVSTTGNDSNAGTSTGAAWKTVQKAVTTLNAGDTVYIRSGEYDGVHAGWIFSHSGSASLPITIKNYPGEQAVFKMTSIESDNDIFKCSNFANQRPEWNTVKADYIKVLGTNVSPHVLSNGVTSSKGIVIQGSEGAQSSGFVSMNCDYWEVAGVDFIDLGSAIFNFKMNFGGLQEYSTDHWNVHHNRVYRFSRESGMQFNGDDNVIEYNEIYKVINTIYSEFGCQHLNLLGDHNVIRGNTISRLGSTAACYGILFEWDLSDDNLIEQNKIYDVPSGIGIHGGDNNIFRNNIIYKSGVASGSGIAIYSYDDNPDWPCNELTDPYSEAILPANNPSHPDYYHLYEPRNCHSYGTQIYNNTIHGFATGVNIFKVSGENTKIKNNAFSGTTIAGVCFYDEGTGSCKVLDSNVTANNNITSGPFGFVNLGTFNFSLSNTSPLIDQGINLGVTVPNDFLGALRPQNSNYDIGAYEFVPTPTSTPTLTASPTPTVTPTVTPTPTPTVPAALNNVYFTFAKFRYNKYASPASLRAGDTAYIKNFDQSKLRLLQVFLYDYEKKGNQGYTKSKVTSTSMFLRTNYNLPTGKRYAYVMKFQDKGTGVVATKYFVVYTTKTWLGKSVL